MFASMKMLNGIFEMQIFQVALIIFTDVDKILFFSAHREISANWSSPGKSGEIDDVITREPPHIPNFCHEIGKFN